MFDNSALKSKLMRILRSLIAVIIAFSLVGCFNVSEDIWINSDQTGRLVADISLSEKIVGFSESISKFANTDDSFNQKKIFDLVTLKNLLDNNSDVQKSDIQEYSESGFRHYVIDAQVKDFHVLPKLSQQILLASDTDSQNIDIDQSLITFQDVNRKTAKFTQFFESLEKNSQVEPKLEEKEAKTKGEAMTKAFFSLILGDQYVTVNLHTKKIGETNGRVSSDGKTVKWTIPITKFYEQDDIKADFEYR